MSDRHTQLFYQITHALYIEGSSIPDGELIRRLAHDGDQAAFELLLWRHGPMVYGICRRVLGHNQDAEDAFQTAVLTLARKGGTIGDATAVAGWLYRVALRVALAARKLRQRRIGREQPRAHVPEVAAGEDPAQAACGRETGQLVDEEIARLPDKYRLPFILCELEGRPRIAVAAELNCAVGTVDSRLSRARERLRARLERRGVTSPASLGAVAVPAALRAATLRAAFTAPAVPGPVGVLGGPVLRFLTTVTRLKVAVAACLLAACVGAAALLPGERSEPPPPTAAAPVPAPAPAVMHEAPLPREALARVGSPRLRHADPVRAVAYSADGKWLASAGADGNVCVWNANTGALRRRITLRGGTPTSARDLLIAFSPDGKELTAFGPKDDPFQLHLRRFDLETGKERATFQAGRRLDETKNPALAADGSVFGYATDKDEYRLFDAASGKLRRSLTLPASWYRPPVIAPNGHTIAFLQKRTTDIDAFSKGARVKAFDVRTGQAYPEIHVPRQQFAGGAFAADGRTLATLAFELGQKQHLALWDVSTGQLLRDIQGAVFDTSCCAAFAPDGKLLAVGTSLGSFVQLFETATGKDLRRFRAARRVEQLAFTPDSRQLAAASSTGSVAVWEVATGMRAPACADPDDAVIALRFTDERHLLLVDGQATIRDWQSGRVVRRLVESVAIPCAGRFAVSPDLRLAAVSPDAGVLQLVDTTTGRLVRTLAGHVEAGGGVSFYLDALEFAPDGRRLFSRGADAFRVWDVATGAQLHKFPLAPDHTGEALAVSPDGKLLAALGWEQEKPVVRLRDVATGRELRRLELPKGRVLDLAFSPDGTVLACGGGYPTFSRDKPGTVTLWDIGTGAQRGTLSGHEDAIYCLRFSPDGRMLVTGGYDGTLRLWELATRRERHVYGGHVGFVLALAYSPDGNWLASYSREAPVYLWSVYGEPKRDGQASELTPAVARQLWEDLAAPDAARAFQAVRRLTAAPAAAVALLRTHLKPRPIPNAQQVGQLLHDLDSPQLVVRQRAAAELLAVADGIAPALRQALAQPASLESKRRLVPLVAALDGPPPARCRELRALEVLEHLGTPDARALLRELARGPATAQLTRDAAVCAKR